MIKLLWQAPESVGDVQKLVQGAIDLEFATLPPYLYAKFSIPDGQNLPAASRMNAIVGQEMIHMCLACNIMNAIGGSPAISPPKYPGPLPGDVGGSLIVHLYPFSEAAMQQGMNIETPVDPTIFPQLEALEASGPVTIGEYYNNLDNALSNLPPSAWTPNRNQMTDDQYFQGQIFPVNSYTDAHQAIQDIVSEGEGSPTANSPLDFQNELAHFFRFEEMYKNQVLVKADNPLKFAWGPPLGIDWNAVYPAISDPESRDFSGDPPAAQAAQAACNDAFTTMVDELRSAFNGEQGRLGNAISAMFGLRMAALHALITPLADGTSVAGPSFLFTGNGGANS
jgi:hypothetical protein